MTSTQSCRLFTLAEIQSATNNFDDGLVIGEGGFGKVYKGQISTDVVAIKRLKPMSNQGEVEFRAEIDMLSTLRHCHLVSLIGYCNENKELILVYEYMPNGTLYHHLHDAHTPLSWLTRLKIAVGAARGLDYLHTGVGTQHGVIHRDVKSANILLDENLAAKISDFGLSKIGPTNQSISFVEASVKGTFGYLDPEYFYTRKLTRKTDVYAFGVVLFELLSGRLPVDERNREECSLVRWAQKCVKERKLDQMVESSIKGMISTKCLRQFTQIAYRCVHSVLKQRPTMTEAVASLQALLDLQVKSDYSSESSGTVGFTWKIHKYFVSPPNSGQSGISSQKKHENNMNQHDEELLIRDVQKFTYKELRLATRDFADDTFLGEGRYGTVYKGLVMINNAEIPIAIKKLHPDTHFDLDVLQYFHHPNLVKPIGYCLKDAHIFLVYEFMSNGNYVRLDNRGLPLDTKVKIVVGIARGLVFLEKTLSNKIWPTFSKSLLYRRNILLDEDLTAKLSDYDVSMFVEVPDQNIDGYLELRSNLSGYAVVFLEVLTGYPIIYSKQVRMIESFFSQCGKESLLHIAKVCFIICNEEDSESKMLTRLEEHDELIRERLGDWLGDPRKSHGRDQSHEVDI